MVNSQLDELIKLKDKLSVVVRKIDAKFSVASSWKSLQIEKELSYSLNSDELIIDFCSLTSRNVSCPTKVLFVQKYVRV